MTDEPRTPPFAQQRLVFVALLAGMVAYAGAAAIVLRQNDGRGLAPAPIPALGNVTVWAGAGLATAAMIVRARLHAIAAAASSAARRAARFRATLVPLAMLEGGCLLGITTWLLDGRIDPGLIVAAVMLGLAVLIVPFREPDEPA